MSDDRPPSDQDPFVARALGLYAAFRWKHKIPAPWKGKSSADLLLGYADLLLENYETVPFEEGCALDRALHVCRGIDRTHEVWKDWEDSCWKLGWRTADEMEYDAVTDRFIYPKECLPRVEGPSSVPQQAAPPTRETQAPSLEDRVRNAVVTENPKLTMERVDRLTRFVLRHRGELEDFVYGEFQALYQKHKFESLSYDGGVRTLVEGVQADILTRAFVKCFPSTVESHLEDLLRVRTVSAYQ